MSVPIQTVYRQFGVKIESLRNALGITQDELAGRMKLSRGSIANIVLNDIEAAERRKIGDDLA